MTGIQILFQIAATAALLLGIWALATADARTPASGAAVQTSLTG